jgi:predicted N-acetyltransferase YhbS
LVRSHSRLTRQAEAEALWQLKDRNFSLRHQELVHTVTEVKQREVVRILRDDRIATFTTNGFTEGCHTKIKMLKQVS